MLTNKISSNLNEALRFSGNPIESPETVAQHIAAMELLAIEIYNVVLNEFPNAKDSFDIGQVCYRISIHDLDEAAMGDIPRPVKYHDKKILAEFERVSNEEMRRNYNEKICSDSENAKDESFYGWIVNLLDVLQCISRLKISYSFSKRYKGHLRNSVEVLRSRLDAFKGLQFDTDDQNKIRDIIAREVQDELLYAFET